MISRAKNKKLAARAALPAKPLMPDLRTVLVLSDGRVGHQNQSVGVARALGVEPEIMTLRPRLNLRWWGWLPVGWVFDNIDAIPPADVVVGTGYQVSRVLRWLRRRGAFVVAVQRPSGLLQDYDVVALPAHDVHHGSPLPAHVMMTTGSPNTLTDEKLAEEADRWRGRLKPLPKPRLAVMIGGASKHGPLSVASVRALMMAVTTWATQQHGALMVSTSRRTGPTLTAVVRRALEDWGGAYDLFEPGMVDNPYTAYLATCEAAVVTVESVSMASDAASAGKPVLGWGDVRHLGIKFQRFYALLEQQFRWQPWPADGSLPPLRKPRNPVRDAALVAGFVRGRWLQKQLLGR